jgi:hypothetical protein
LITSDITHDNAGKEEAASKIEQEVDAEDDVPTNIAQEDLEKEEEMINNSSRVQYITKRGRNVKLRKDLFENYEFLQEDVLKNSEDQKRCITVVPKTSAQTFPPKETREATLTELMQLHNYWNIPYVHSRLVLFV